MLSAAHYSTHTVLRSLQSVCQNGSIKEGAHHARDHLLNELVFGLRNLIDNQTELAVRQKETTLENQTLQITENILNARFDGHEYRCHVFFGDKKFLLSQADDSSDIEISDLKTGERTLLKKISFSALKKKMLIQYLALDAHELHRLHSLADIDFCQISINTKNIAAIISAGGNLRGAIFSEPLPSPHQWLKPFILSRYIHLQIDEGNIPVDISWLDLSGIDLRQINFHHVELNQTNLEAALHCGSDIQGAILSDDIDASRLPLNHVRLDKNLAQALIFSGTNQLIVLKNYFATPKKTSLCGHSKTRMLNIFLDAARAAKNVPVDVSEFDFTDIHLEKINFSGTQIHQSLMNDIIARGGNLSGAALAPGVRVSATCFLDDVWIDKPMAAQLIRAGADKRAVLIRYLATERRLPHTLMPIDLSGLDLQGVSRVGLDLRNVDWKKSLTGTDPEITEEYKKRIHAHFEHDVLLMLTLISQTVQRTLLKSSTRDVVDDVFWKITDTHNDIITEHIRERDFNSQMFAAIKSSSGNCGEMAELCKLMVDKYLKNCLTDLGYQGVEIKALYAISTRPSDHDVAIIECEFFGYFNQFIGDPWSHGQAWKFLDALKYYEDHGRNHYVKPGIQFTIPARSNLRLNELEYQSQISSVLTKFNLEKQLHLAIKNERAFFKRLPLS